MKQFLSSGVIIMVVLFSFGCGGTAQVDQKSLEATIEARVAATQRAKVPTVQPTPKGIILRGLGDGYTQTFPLYRGRVTFRVQSEGVKGMVVLLFQNDGKQPSCVNNQCPGWAA